MAVKKPEVVHALEQTSLWYDLDEYGYPELRYADGDYLLSTFILRSGIVLPDAKRSSGQGWCGGQVMPGSRLLVSAQPLGVRDVLLFGDISRAYYADCMPAHRTVPLSLRGAADAMGYARKGGGRRNELARQSLRRLYETDLVWEEWTTVDHHVQLHFRLLESLATDNTKAAVKLTGIGAQLVQGSVLAYLRRDTARCIVADDELAARLWMFLEGENHRGRTWHYRVFRAPKGGTRKHTDAPIISEILGMTGWSRRRRVAERITAAVDVITRHDGDRWALHLEHERTHGMWTLHAKRSPRHGPTLSTPSVGTRGVQPGRGGVQRGRRGVQPGRGGVQRGRRVYSRGRVLSNFPANDGRF
jgi:hypothetical protein